MSREKYPTTIGRVSIPLVSDPPSAPCLKINRIKRENPALLSRRCLLLFEVLEALFFLTELLPQSPAWPQQERYVHRPGLRVRLRILDGDVVHQVLVIDPPDALYNVQSIAVRVTHSIDPGFIVEV